MAVFIQIPGMKGSSTDSKHKGDEGWFTVENFNIGVMQSTTAMVAGKGSQNETESHPHFQDISFMKKVDAATPQLAGACAAAKSFAKVIVEFVAQGNNSSDVYLKYTLEHALISSTTIGQGEGRPDENITIGYATIKTEYTSRDEKLGPKGTSTSNWNLLENTGSPGV